MVGNIAKQQAACDTGKTASEHGRKDLYMEIYVTLATSQLLSLIDFTCS